MKLSDIIKTANTNLLRNKVRTFLTILAIFIGSFTIILNQAIDAGVNTFIDQQIESYGGDGYLVITSEAAQARLSSMMTGFDQVREYHEDTNANGLTYITESDLEKIRQIDGVKSVALMKNYQIEYVTSPKTDKKYQINLQALPSETVTIDMETGHNVDMFAEQPQITLPPNYATALGFESNQAIVGQTVQIAIQQAAKCPVVPKISDCLVTIDATVVGIQAPGVVSLGSGWSNLAFEDKAHNIYTTGLPASTANQSIAAAADVDPDQIPAIKDTLKELGLIGTTVDDTVSSVKGFFDIILTVFNIFGVIALLAATIGIINTLFMSVQERTREIGLMKALGMSNAKIFLSFSIEAIALGFWGSILGIIVSIITGYSANALAHETFLADFPTFTLVEFRPLDMLFIILLIMLIAFLAGTLPARRASKENPIDALRYE